MKQSKVFLDGEANQWLKRNKAKIAATKPEDDPILQAIEKYGLGFKTVLEVGCANGWRLEALERDYNVEAWGTDPVANPFRNKIIPGTADSLSMKSDQFDLVIYGWCLYLADPEDYFKIAMEGDRVLKDGGFLIVYDFHADFPYKTPYKHKEGLFSHHYDFSKLWMSHPAYSLYGRTIQEETSVTILQKNMATAFPVEK